MAEANLTAEQLREILDYDPETGVFKWKVRPSIRVRAIGAVAGVRSNGYIAIGFAGRTYYAHRLAWLYVHGVWPEKKIDHINGDRSDNRIANLRDVSHSVNLQNIRASHADSRSGLLGVSAHRKRWDADIHIDGRRVRLGRFDSPEDAHQAYLAAKRRLHEGNTL